MPFVTTWRNNFLNRAFRNVAFTAPTALQFSPYSSSPAADGTGGSEITVGGATRKSVTWDTPGSAQVSNSVTLTITPTPGGATADWPLCTHFALHNLADGAMIAFGPTVPARQVLTAGTFPLRAGEIQIADAPLTPNRWMSWWAVNGLLAELTGVGTPVTFPATPYWGLYTAFPSRDGSDAGVEVTGVGYARVSRSLVAASAGAVAPSGSINFGNAGGAWGQVVALGCFTAATAGNLIGLLELESPVVIASGAPVLVPASAVSFALS